VLSIGVQGQAEGVVPRWPHQGLEKDLAKAWVILEVLGIQPEEEAALKAQMNVHEKRAWLAYRLFRIHHSSERLEDDDEEMIVIACERGEHIIGDMRKQWLEGGGLASDAIDRLEVHFKGESSAGSAVMREWFGLVGVAFAQEDIGLLASYDGGRTYRPSPSAHLCCPTWRDDCQMLGKIIGLALLHQVCVGLRLERSFCELLLNGNKAWPWQLRDVERLDEDFYKHKVRHILEHSVEGLELDFTDALDDRAADYLAGEAGARDAETIRRDSQRSQRQELKPGGGELPVTDMNKAEYVDLLCHSRLFGAIELTTQAVLDGLYKVVPKEVMSSFASMATADELTDLVGGLPHISVEDWRRNTRYAGGYTEGHQIAIWFWQAVESFSVTERELLLQFGTGSRFAPVGGFAHLQGFNGGLHLFSICKAMPRAAADGLPTAHACICTVDIPEYRSAEELQTRLRIAVTMGSTGFDDPAVAEPLDGPEAPPE